MTTFAYTTGNPANLTGGANASMNDIQGPLNDLRTFLNGGNIDTTNLAAAIVAALAQPGDIKMAASAAPPPPTGWLLCNGVAVSRTTYSALFSAIGTAFGAGNGTTTFNVPDLRGRVPMGADNYLVAGQPGRVLTGTPDQLGQSTGEENHLLTTAEMPAHTHPAPKLGSTGNGGAPNTERTVLGGIDVTGSTGGGVAHNNMQPYVAVNYLIKT